MLPILTPILQSVTSVIDKLIPDPQEKQRLKAEMEQALLNADLQQELARYQTITAEAQSPDKWTSRARPSFMYVFYALLLASIPMGVLYAFHPITAMGIAAGLKAWFSAIPEELYDVFLFGYLGYSASRSFDKMKGSK